MRLFHRAIAIVLNLAFVWKAAAYGIFVIWFARYQDRNVGPSMTYAAWVVVTGIVAQVANLLLWILLRRQTMELRFLRRLAVSCFLLVLLFCWLGNRFMYYGEKT